jgi:hypothetical protein
MTSFAEVIHNSSANDDAVNYDNDLRQALDQLSQDLDRPPPLPPGPYETTVESYEVRRVGSKMTPAVVFRLRGFFPGNPASPEELKLCGDLAKLSMKYTLYLTDAAKWRVRTFLDHLDAPEDAHMTLGQRLKESINRQVVVMIVQERSKTSGEIFANINSTQKR